MPPGVSTITGLFPGRLSGKIILMDVSVNRVIVARSLSTYTETFFKLNKFEKFLPLIVRGAPGIPFVVLKLVISGLL